MASAVVFLAIGGLAYGLASSARNSVEQEVLSSAVQGANLVGSLAGGLPKLTPQRMRGFTPAQVRAADAALADARDEGALTGLLLINTEGKVVYAEDHALIGSTPPVEPDIQAALSGQDASEKRPRADDFFHRQHGPALEAYVPLTRGNQVIGALELAQPLGPLTARTDQTTSGYYLAIGGGGVLIWLLLLPLVVRFARLAEKNFEPGRRRRLRELRTAIRQRKLEVHYQPIIDARTGCLTGTEALVRWRRGTELVPPMEFLPLAESSGLIAPLTECVLDEAVAQAAAWLAGGRELSVSVNLSARSLLEPSLPHDIEAVLTKHGLPPRLLLVEITETAVIDDEGQATESLDAISRLGVRISLDDFGTGYSSMTRVSQLPITELKVDRSFISNLDAKSRPLVCGMVELGHTLGLQVVAEGVEDHATLTALREMGCDLVQGFYFSRPLPAAELDRWRDVPRINSEEVRELLFEASLDGYFTKLTRAWERCLGFGREKLMGKPFLDFVHPEDLESTIATTAALLDGRSSVVQFENRYRTGDGSWQRLAWTARSDGRRFYGIARAVDAPPRRLVVAAGAVPDVELDGLDGQLHQARR